jgi:hypothetical protein
MPNLVWLCEQSGGGFLVGFQFMSLMLVYSLLHTVKWLQHCKFFHIEVWAGIILLFLQRDGTYMFNLDGFILKLCHLAQQMGDDVKVQHLRAAGLQVLSSMVIWCLLYLLFHFLFNVNPFFNVHDMLKVSKEKKICKMGDLVLQSSHHCEDWEW